jgi:hypothetical protein
MAKDVEREARLAEALRANLRRRKDRQRAGSAEQPESESQPESDGDRQT